MHWSRIKSILIGVFIFLNVYLLIQYFDVNESTDVLSRTTIENTVALLENKEVTVTADIIPRRIKREPETDAPYKTGADALITFADTAVREGVTPCQVESLELEDGIWIITTNKGEYKFDGMTLNQQ